MSFRSFTILFSFLFFFSFAGVVSANVLQSLPNGADGALKNYDPQVHEYFKRSVALVFYEKDEACLKMLKQFSKSYPDHPAPDFLKAACYQSYMNTFRTNRFTTIMDQHVDAAILKGSQLLKRSDDLWLHFYVGGAYGFRALGLINSTIAVKGAPQIIDLYYRGAP